MSNSCIDKMENISTIVNLLYDNKQNIKNNDYLVLMNALKKLYEYKPKITKSFVCEGCNMEYCNHFSESDDDENGL